ncbi:ABC transporter ATP-binding protein [Maledivibacter halophilus]|uniref:Peptide/nickel transport system ATP-binding protein n=1 Tax=Maledivibacter halophilus TaxID=36842 RepID=A0A1T5LSX7_9FIRM|nr:oligopeptide/dipeptide ABC transporter ATP-binding protein [Maledivibacter halophilus]SKC78994.1 peptide/nickel transport system ATP-binding protein [Maledivibacter halophilus]
MAQALIQTKDLKKYFKTPYGNLHAVDGVNISIKRGQTLGVVGESGCGKSTLGRTVLRLIEATDGEILFEGKKILDYNKKEMKKMRKEMQIIFQDPYASLNPRMTVSELIAAPIKVNKTLTNKMEIEKKVHQLMETVGLAQRLVNAYPHELDGGRRQRIGIARALALEPKFIVCDEPVSALDVSIQAQILNLMMDLQDEMGLTYMFITHDLSVVKHISDEIAVMYLGQCVEKAPSNELFKNPLHPYTKALLSAIPVPDIRYKGKKREVIKGEVTSPINPKPGCRFASRCPLAKKECTGVDLQLKEVDKDHFVSCILF